MDDLQRAVAKRKSCDPEFAKSFDNEYEEFKIGVMLKEARKNAGYTGSSGRQAEYQEIGNIKN